MRKAAFSILIVFLPLLTFSQPDPFTRFLTDSTLKNASVSLCIMDADSGKIVLSHQPQKSLIPASVLKIVTTAAAIELLGADHKFKTILGYTGHFNKKSGRLDGDIIIKGGGDPALGSKYFKDHYGEFIEKWIRIIKESGIRKVTGRIITDDSYFDAQPVPSKWLWEDAGNYYGAGVYGLSVFDNTYEIHFQTGIEGSVPVITGINPPEQYSELENLLISSGTSDEGYVFAAPYSNSGWIAGTIPVNSDDFILKASITDPPLLLAKILDKKLSEAGISITGKPSTFRSEKEKNTTEPVPLDEIYSPPLSDIIEVLNHESVNLFAEHLFRELGKRLNVIGTTGSGSEVIEGFLENAGIKDGMFIEDGSGLSPLNAVTSSGLAGLLLYMKKNGKYFNEYFSSFPDAGKEGTLKTCFRDPVFDSRLYAKSGSMTRVRSYAGYFRTLSGREMVFAIIVNNYTGPSKSIVAGIEQVIKSVMMESYH